MKSCWGGMVAFEAKWFQPEMHTSADNTTGLTREAVKGNTNGDVPASDRPYQSTLPTFSTIPLRFRAEIDPYWDASECCLIHADLASLASSLALPGSGEYEGAGIYMNPYVRVAYSTSVLRLLPFAARFERLYQWPHLLINRIGRRPTWNPRQFHRAGEEVVDRVWKWNRETMEAIHDGTLESLKHGPQGKYESVRRVAGEGMFCGGRKSRYLTENGDMDGRKKWGNIVVPPDLERLKRVR